MAKDSPSGLRVAVIGGSGFIGTRLVENLLAGRHEVRIVDKVPSRRFPALSFIADVRDLSRLDRGCAGAQVVYHLAAEHRDDVRPKRLYHEVNVGGAENLCRVARRRGIRKIIFTSSVAVYGLCRNEADETTPPRPFSEYGRSKLAAENIFRAWAEESSDRSLTILRPTVVFGHRNRGNVHTLIRQIASGRFAMVGSGRNRKSMAYVDNVAAFLEFCLKFGPGTRIYNYADKPDLDMNQLVHLIRQQLGLGNGKCPKLPYFLGYGAGLMCDMLAILSRRRLAISSVRVRKFCAETRFSATKLAETGFVPPVSLEEGLRRTIKAELGVAEHDYRKAA